MFSLDKNLFREPEDDGLHDLLHFTEVPRLRPELF